MQFFTYDSWQIEETYSDSETRQNFSSLEDVFSCPGERIVSDKTSEVIKFSGSMRSYFIKRYTGPKRKYFRRFRNSVVHAEAKNLIAMARIGLPVPGVIAHGERRKNGRFLLGALITEEVSGSANLAHYLRNNPELLADKEWLCAVIDQVAVHAYEMHKHKFVHRDLNLRNVLVQTHGQPVIHFIDCPAGGFRRGYFLKREIVRDLAHLDKAARYLLSAKDLLRFYKKYQGIDKLSSRDKRFIARIRHFHDKHRLKQKRRSEKPYRDL